MAQTQLIWHGVYGWICAPGAAPCPSGFAPEYPGRVGNVVDEIIGANCVPWSEGQWAPAKTDKVCWEPPPQTVTTEADTLAECAHCLDSIRGNVAAGLDGCLSACKQTLDDCRAQLGVSCELTMLDLYNVRQSILDYLSGKIDSTLIAAGQTLLDVQRAAGELPPPGTPDVGPGRMAPPGLPGAPAGSGELSPSLAAGGPGGDFGGFAGAVSGGFLTPLPPPHTTVSPSSPILLAAATGAPGSPAAALPPLPLTLRPPGAPATTPGAGVGVCCPPDCDAKNPLAWLYADCSAAFRRDFDAFLPPDYAAFLKLGSAKAWLDYDYSLTRQAFGLPPLPGIAASSASSGASKPGGQ